MFKETKDFKAKFISKVLELEKTKNNENNDVKSKNTHIFDTAKDNDEDPKSPKLIHKNSEATKRNEIMDKNGNVVTDSKGPNTREDEDKVKLARRPSQVNPVPKPWWCDLELNTSFV